VYYSILTRKNNYSIHVLFPAVYANLSTVVSYEAVTNCYLFILSAVLWTEYIHAEIQFETSKVFDIFKMQIIKVKKSSHQLKWRILKVKAFSEINRERIWFSQITTSPTHGHKIKMRMVYLQKKKKKRRYFLLDNRNWFYFVYGELFSKCYT
jgi:hypothetical protein